MKWLLLILTIFTFTNSYTQTITAKGTKQEWASGICYRTGTIYGITVSADSSTLNSVDFQYAVIDGNKFDISGSTTRKISKNSIVLGFEIIKDRYPINKVDENPTQYEGCYIKIAYQNKHIQIPIESIEELFYIAYP